MIPLITYLLKIDRETWAAFKTRLQNEGRTVKWTLAELINQYIRHGLKEPKDKK